MLINEVESKVGLTKKSIRFYEDNGLISPNRSENSYRTYNDEDIRMLRIIKFLRNLNVSVNDIKKLQNGKLTLHDCMEERINDISSTENNLNEIKKMCMSIFDSNDNFEDFDIDSYYVKMNVLNKAGITLKKGDDIMNKKMITPIISGIVFCLLFIFVIATMFWANSQDPLPLPIFVFMITLLVIPIIGIVFNIFERIKEIKGGEEDEASKY